MEAILPASGKLPYLILYSHGWMVLHRGLQQWMHRRCRCEEADAGYSQCVLAEVKTLIFDEGINDYGDEGTIYTSESFDASSAPGTTPSLTKPCSFLELLLSLERIGRRMCRLQPA